MNKCKLWQEIFNLSYGNTWQPIPEYIKRELGLDSRLGIMGGVLCTAHTAGYVNDFITRLNSISDKVN